MNQPFIFTGGNLSLDFSASLGQVSGKRTTKTNGANVAFEHMEQGTTWTIHEIMQGKTITYHVNHVHLFFCLRPIQ